MCVFCEINESLLLKETSHSRLIANYFPLGKFALLAIPKNHVATIANLSEEELIDLMLLYQSAVRTINEKTGQPDLIGWFNQGTKAGQSVPHFHFHLAILQENGNLKTIERLEEKIPIQSELLESIKALFR